MDRFEVIEATGACRFCGQIRTMEATAYATPEDIEETATLECDCTEARIYAKKQSRKKRALERVIELFGDEQNPEKNYEIIELMSKAIDCLTEYRIEGVSISIGAGVRAKLVQAANGIKIERSYTNKQSFEE